MLVVLILSGIISGVIFFCFFTITTYQINLSKKLDAVNDATIFYSNLTKDVKRCQIVSVDNNLLRCSFLQNGTVVNYEFFAEYIIRKQMHQLDTFKCLNDLPYYAFQGKRLVESKGYLDSVSIRIEHAGRTNQFTVKKIYDRATLLQITSDSLKQ